MDAVITYVNGLDPVWQEEYLKTMDIPPAAGKRFRDWGTLKYLLRGIQTHMPFIRNVYLVVSGPTQVPQWASDGLKTVTHKEIIPERFLPTFNSTTIELFLHRIPGLDERFIYFNDDMFPVLPCREEDFFVDGKPAIGFSRHLFARSMYKRQCRNSDWIARKALGIKPSLLFMRAQHTCSPMLRSENETLFSKMETEIFPTISQTRTVENLNQYVFLDYLYHQGKAVNRRAPAKFFSLSTSPMERICSFIAEPGRKLFCINDVHLSEEKFERYRSMLVRAFEETLPGLSRFENPDEFQKRP